MIQEHSTALTKLEIQLGQDVNIEQSLESSCAYIHRQDLELEVLSQSANSLEFFFKSYVPSLESFGDDFLPYQEENKSKLDDKSLLPIHHKKEDSELDDEIDALNEFHLSLAATNLSIEIIAPATSSTIFKDMLLRKERRKHHHNQVFVEIQRTTFKDPQKKPLLPTKVQRYLDFLPP
ncbi:unnamed protein product [Malus baccata var. baccata]